MATQTARTDKTYDVTACPLHLCPSFVGRKTLKLDPEEAILTNDCCLGCHSVANRPYGELGSVEKNICCCCIGFTSNLSPQSPEGQTMAIVPGCCCETELVEEIIAELKARMKTRGDTGNIQRAEENLAQIKHLHAKVDAVMAHLHVPPVPEPMKMEERA